MGKILREIGMSQCVLMDRWRLNVTPNDDASDDHVARSKDNVPLNVINNYFSFGVDAHIALEFHEAREAHPERFNSRLRNKMYYGQMGGKDLILRQYRNLSQWVTLECDGQDYTGKLRDAGCHAVLFLNIPRYFYLLPQFIFAYLKINSAHLDDGFCIMFCCLFQLWWWYSSLE